MYDALWDNWYFPAALPALERLFFSKTPPRARVLDLCCGSGHITKELVSRGYDVTGIDSSAALISLARRALPGTDFRVEDARHLQIAKSYAGVLSTFDALNHIMTLEELGDVFRGVHSALEPGGLFVFDMNLEEAYSIAPREWMSDISENAVGLVRGTYDALTRKAATELIWFVRTGTDNTWTRRRSVIEERCYSQSEIVRELTAARFNSIEAIPAIEAGMRSDMAFGRLFFVARR